MQLLIDLANNEFGGGDCGKDEARILLASFSCKDLTGASYLFFSAKNVLNFLQHAFTQVLILQHFYSKWHIRIEFNVLGYNIVKVLIQLILDN